MLHDCIRAGANFVPKPHGMQWTGGGSPSAGLPADERDSLDGLGIRSRPPGRRAQSNMCLNSDTGAHPGADGTLDYPPPFLAGISA